MHHSQQSVGHQISNFVPPPALRRLYRAGCRETVQRDSRGGRRKLSADHLHQSHGGVASGNSSPDAQLPPPRGGHPGDGCPAVRRPLQPGQAGTPADSLAGDDDVTAQHAPHLLPPAEVHRPGHSAALTPLLGQPRPRPGLQHVEHHDPRWDDRPVLGQTDYSDHQATAAARPGRTRRGHWRTSVWASCCCWQTTAQVREVEGEVNVILNVPMSRHCRF